MDIQNNPSNGPARTSPLRSIQNTDESSSGAAASTDASRTPRPAEETGDRVEISDSGREAQTSMNAADASLVERGREALESSSLSEERLQELKQRAESGYYTEPEATRQIAERLTEEAGGA